MGIQDLPPSHAPDILAITVDMFLFCILIGFILHIWHGRGKPHGFLDTSKMKLAPSYITLILLVIALFAPAALGIYIQSDGLPIFDLFGMTYQFSILNFNNAHFGIFFFLFGGLFMCLRLVFVYQIYKFYLHRTTRSSAINYGILGELQFTLISLVIIPFGLVTPSIAVLIPIPLPFLLVTGLLLLRFVPRPEKKPGWEELDEGKDWWEKEKEETSVPDNA
ncbi:MAG: hypothetical protein RTU63_10675 [Candidatus Thorarchaeota archaeon]